MIKEICKNCVSANSTIFLKWNWEDDINWEKKKKVFCFAEEDDIDIKEEVPKRCPYILEHTIFNNKKIHHDIK